MEYVLPFVWWLLTSTDLQAQMTMTLLVIMSTFMIFPFAMMLMEARR